jgi:hypothetical protein
MQGELKRDTPRKKLFPVTRTPQNTLGTWHCGAATKSKYPGGVQVSSREGAFQSNRKKPVPENCPTKSEKDS